MLTKYDPTVKPFTFPSMKKLNPLIDETLEGIVLRAVQLDHLKRYISVMDFKEKLLKYNRTNVSTEYEKSALKPNKWAVRSKQCAYGTFIIPVIIFLFTIMGSIFIPDNYTGYEIRRIMLWFFIIPMFLCPVAGLITGIIASRKAAKDIYYEPAGDAIGCNIFIITALILLSCILVPNFMKSRASGEIAACQSNLTNLATALDMYAQDNNGKYPYNLNKILEKSKVEGYMLTIPMCPSFRRTSSYGYTVTKNCDSFTLWCKHTRGHMPPAYPPGYPQYTHGIGIDGGFYK